MMIRICVILWLSKIILNLGVLNYHYFITVIITVPKYRLSCKVLLINPKRNLLLKRRIYDFISKFYTQINLNTSIAAWVKNPFRRTSDHDRTYEDIITWIFHFFTRNNFFFLSNSTYFNWKLGIVWHILMWFFRYNYQNLQNHWTLEIFRKNCNKNNLQFLIFRLIIDFYK